MPELNSPSYQWRPSPTGSFRACPAPGNSGDFLHPKDPDFLRDGAPYGAPADRGLQAPALATTCGLSPKMIDYLSIVFLKNALNFFGKFSEQKRKKN